MFIIKFCIMFFAFVMAAAGVYCCTDTYFDKRERKNAIHLTAAERQSSAYVRMVFCMSLSLALIACDIILF